MSEDFDWKTAERLRKKQKGGRDTNERNRSWNSQNPYQGSYKKVLCVCSAGILRSPTAAMLLSQEPYNFNTRAAGLESSYALVVVDGVLLDWADEIVCMTQLQANELKQMTPKKVISLGIEDSYGYRDPDLLKLIKERYDAALNESEDE